MKKRNILWSVLIPALLIAFILFATYILPGLYRDNPIPGTQITLMIHGLGKDYLFSVTNEGDLQSISGICKKFNFLSLGDLKQKTIYLGDLKQKTIYDDIHLSHAEVLYITTLAERAIESIGNSKNIEVKDCDGITLWYEDAVYEGYYTVARFPALCALADALIELSPMPYETSGYS